MHVASRQLASRCNAPLRLKFRISAFHRRTISSSHPKYSDRSSATETPVASTTEYKGKEKETTQETNSQYTGTNALPLLQRPLGVRERPQAKVKSWADTKEKFMDQDKRLEERTHLAREATRGYFSDLSATRKHGGKTWIAPTVMIREDKALYFPDIYGTPLAGGHKKVHTTDILEGKVSLVALLTTRISEVQTQDFVGSTQAAFSSHPLFQFVQINLQDNLVKSFLVSMFASGIRNSVPEALWPTYMISNQNMEYLRQPLGLANKHVGYVYLVDPKLRIRWAGCADPKSEEVAALKVCTGVLLDRSLEKRLLSENPPPELVQQHSE